MRRHDPRLDELEQTLARIDRSIDRIEVATIVREPTTGPAAEAYEGLRRQVVAAAAERTAHLRQLAQFAEAVRTGDRDALPGMVADWMRQAELQRHDDAGDDRYFDVLGQEPGHDDPPPGTRRTVLRPAYVDAVTGRPIMMGQAADQPAGTTATSGSL